MGKSKSITAYLLRVDEEGKQYQGYLSEVENSLSAEQKYVGGYIQVIRFVFCKCFLAKVAKYFWRMLHLQIGESCKALTGSCPASRIAIADQI